MARATLTIDLDAVQANWRALDALSGPATATAAVVKADAYGCGAARVAPALMRAGCRHFFVALAEEGAELRAALGAGPEIFVLSGPMAGDAPLLREHALIPVVNSEEQLARHRAELAGQPYAVQLDTGMNRLGMDGLSLARAALGLNMARPRLVLSHLACADSPAHPMNAAQLAAFAAMAMALPGVPRSLAATGGILMGPAFHFEMTRPGIGIYGGLPFAGARPVVSLALPVLQLRDVMPGQTVGYGAAWTAERPSRVAILAAGYADGLMRALGGRACAFAAGRPCPVIGRVSMDMIAIDATGIDPMPATVEILGPHQGIDALAEAAGTIGYEILTALGSRYARHYKGGEG
ncbi:MAG: alanine racemase [Alphaproteobacteria bacterium]|nr:MAG: alanine racemase [Alphaproteobacteria bacterium]